MELKKAIKICADFIDENKSRPIILHKAMKTVLQELAEATEERDMYLRQLNRVFDNGFISKKKIEDKIEGIKTKYLTRSEDIQNETCNTFMYYTGMVEVLQQLLEDK